MHAQAQALASCVVAALQSRASSSGSPVVLPPSYADILTTGLLAGQVSHVEARLWEQGRQ